MMRRNGAEPGGARSTSSSTDGEEEITSALLENGDPKDESKPHRPVKAAASGDRCHAEAKKDQCGMRLWRTLRWSIVSLASGCRFGRLVGCFLFFICFIVIVVFPMALHVIETRYPTVPLQLHVNVYPPQRANSMDDVASIKSCRYAGHYRRWMCHTCSVDDTKQTHCQRLQPKGRCPSFRRRNWPDATQSISLVDPDNANPALEYRTIRHAGGRFVYHSQPQCTSLTNPYCFNLHNCHSNGTTTARADAPLAVYVNVTNATRSPLADSLLELAVQHSIIRRVYDYRQACLILVLTDTYETVADLYAAEHWTGVHPAAPFPSLDSANHGRNHIMYNMSRFRFRHAKRLSSDAPIALYHVGLAAVASDAWIGSIFRSGFDQALPLPRHWNRVGNNAFGNHNVSLDIHRPRKWLLSFRGTIKDGLQPYYQHRWLAAEYWDDPDVLVDVRCVHSTWFGAVSRTVKEYDDSGASYDALMWDSTFGFAPGGSGVGSYRLGEILSTGGIPVVTHDLVLPLAPEIDWSGCVVHVSEAHIIDLPRQLRTLSALEVRSRQQRCWQLLQTVIGDHDPYQNGHWTSDERVTFATSMKVWSVRIAHAWALQHELDTINKSD